MLVANASQGIAKHLDRFEKKVQHRWDSDRLQYWQLMKQKLPIPCSVSPPGNCV